MDLSLPLGTRSAPGFRPAFRVAAGSAGGGGLGALAGAAASLLGAAGSDPWADHLRSVDLVLEPAPGVDRCLLELAPGVDAPEVALDDPLTVELGYEDALTKIFTGSVTAVSAHPAGRVVELASPAVALARLRENASFEQQGFADLVRQWAGAASVTPGTLESGASYPFLAVDDRRSAWAWIALLARQAGVLAWCDGEGELQCKRPAGAPVRTFRYGEEVLRLRTTERSPLLGEVTLCGEGASGSQGAQAWSWLAKEADATTARAGAGDPKRLWQSGALRDQAGLQAAAKALNEGAERLRRGVAVTVPGSPELTVGAVFALSGCPAGRGDGSYAVLRARHRYDKRHGFRTEVIGGAL